MNEDSFSQYLEGPDSPLDKPPIQGTQHYSADLPNKKDLPDNTLIGSEN